MLPSSTRTFKAEDLVVGYLAGEAEKAVAKAVPIKALTFAQGSINAVLKIITTLRPECNPKMLVGSTAKWPT